jgi:uncharacterized tellurite resistance protein B-like protein
MIKNWWNNIIAQPQSNGSEKKQSSVAKHNDIANNIALLVAEVLRSGKNFSDSEEQYSAAFFKEHFGTLNTNKLLDVIRGHFTIGSRPMLRICCRQLLNDIDEESHKLIVRFLFGVAASDTFIHAREMRAIQRIAVYLNISEAHFIAIKDEFVSKNNPYYILGINDTATLGEVKKAYRMQVLKHHPDKRNSNTSEQDANQEYLKIQHAYQVIIASYA